MQNRRITLGCLLAAGIFTGPAQQTAQADGARYSDMARVIAVSPITERVYENRRHRECAEPAPPPLLPVARRLGEDILRQQQLSTQIPECRWVEERTPVERILGYKVTYSYGGRQYTRRMDRHPGDRVPVRVALEPLAY